MYPSLPLPQALHVKWFTEHNDLVPASVAKVASNPAFLFWLFVTLAGLFLTAWFNDRLQQLPFITRIHGFLDRAKPHVTLVLRIGLGLTLAFQLLTGTYIAPELQTHDTWIYIAQAVALAALFMRKTLWISGAAILSLYLNALSVFGWFHALDYMFYIGIIYYLMVDQTRYRATATPLLYLLTGLSLAWVSFEKFTLPELAYDIVQDKGIPTFGFSIENFVLISAFIEIGLAWSFIVGILNRFVSIVVTLVFLTTTMVFGFTEVVGHTILHTLLIMFIIVGEGAFTTPFHFHRSKGLRLTFVLVNFCVLLFGFMSVYVLMGS